MKKFMVRLMAVLGFMSLNAWADLLPGESMGGVYSLKDTNIVAISGRTYVKTSETRLFECGGKPVKALPNGSDVRFTIVEPSKGPTPILKTVSEICS